MILKVYLPSGIFLDKEVTKVIAEGEDGFFCLLPRHIDFLSCLVPGLLSYEVLDGLPGFLAVHSSVLVKIGSEVRVSTRNAVQDPDLQRLRQTVKEQFEAQDQHERRVKSAMASLESNFVRRFFQHGKPR